MPADRRNGRPTWECSWCGSEASAKVCPACSAPQKLESRILFVLNILMKLALPAVISVIALVFSGIQKKNDDARAEQQKLVGAYQDVASVISDYKASANVIKMLAFGPFIDLSHPGDQGSKSADAPRISAKELKDAVVKVGRSFDSIAAKLTPFELAEAPGSGGKSLLEETWRNCFLYSYFAGHDDDKGDDSQWSQIQAQLRLCNTESCPVDAAADIGRVLDKVDRPTCHAMSNGIKSSSLNWIWHQLTIIIECQRASGRTMCPTSK